jgi:hypothetical protein
MYKHIFLNSTFNLIFCLINIFSLMNVCIFPLTSYCSKIYKQESTQYYKIFILFFLGNAVKLCCNFSYVFFSFSRFNLSKSLNSDKGFFKKLVSIHSKRTYLFLVILSLLFSAFKIFEYKPNEAHSYLDRNFPYNLFDPKYCQDQNFYNRFSFKCQLFPILNLLNNIFNNITFLVLNIIIDIFLVKFSNETLKKKITILTDQDHINEAIKHRDKINRMVVFNGLLYFVAHAPEFTITILIYIFKKELNEFCVYYFSCTEIIELFESFSLVSISLQFFIFKHFDHNFGNSYIEIKNRFF